MPFTNAWDETTPTGKNNASTTDDFFRKHRLDLGERLQDMFMGFNASSNASPENNIGVKFLKCYKQSSDPSSATDFGHLYVKLVSGVPELFFQDDTNTTLQLTSGGKLYSSTTLETVGNATIGGALDVVGNIDPTTYEKTNGGFLDEDDMASDADDKVASQQSIKAYIDAGFSFTDSGQESVTFHNGIILKFGVEEINADTVANVTYTDAFPNGPIAVFATYRSTSTSTTQPCGAIPESGSEKTVLQVINSHTSSRNVNWLAIGH